MNRNFSFFFSLLIACITFFGISVESLSYNASQGLYFALAALLAGLGSRFFYLKHKNSK